MYCLNHRFFEAFDFVFGGADLDWKDAGDKLHEITKQYCLENGTPYEEGFHEVKKANPELYKRYTVR